MTLDVFIRMFIMKKILEALLNLELLNQKLTSIMYEITKVHTEELSKDNVKFISLLKSDTIPILLIQMRGILSLQQQNAAYSEIDRISVVINQFISESKKDEIDRPTYNNIVDQGRELTLEYIRQIQTHLSQPSNTVLRFSQEKSTDPSCPQKDSKPLYQKRM